MSAIPKKWSFHPVEPKMPHLESRDARDNLMKWGLKDTVFFFKFIFDESLQPYQLNDFIRSFVSTPEGQRAIGIRNAVKDKLAPDEAIPIGKVKTVQLSCTLTDMNLLKRFEEIGAVSETGVIKKCFQIPHPDFEVIDRVREALVCDDSELFEEFEASDRKEFLFHIFRRLIFGGELCQYDDTIDPYLEMTKSIYKDLVSVQRNPTTGKLETRSLVFQLSSAANAITDASGRPIPVFPGRDTSNPRNGLYFVVDPAIRTLNVMLCLR